MQEDGCKILENCSKKCNRSIIQAVPNSFKNDSLNIDRSFKISEISSILRESSRISSVPCKEEEKTRILPSDLHVQG